jgi:hypothetical protein
MASTTTDERGSMTPAQTQVDHPCNNTSGTRQPSSCQQLWNWTVGSKPIPGQLLAGLIEEQRTDVIRVLDGMIRERSDGNGPAVLTAPLNIGVGTK